MHYFIVNPNSRSGAGRKIWRLLRNELALRRVSYRAYLTQYAGHAAELASMISAWGSEEDPAYIVAVGGDGTLQEVLTGIRSLENVYFGYIPTGSGNDFCRSMRLPTRPLAALDAILRRERILLMDVPRITCQGKNSRFGISAGIGYDAAVCHEVAVSPVKKLLNKAGLGKLVYLLIALKQLISTAPAGMDLEMNGRRRYHFDRVYFVAVMNQQYEGGGFRFCPKARPDDGILDVIAVENISKLKILFCLPLALFGKHEHIKGIHLFRCKSIHIYSAVPRALHKDGENGGIQQDFTIKIEKNALKVILPVI